MRSNLYALLFVAIINFMLISIIHAFTYLYMNSFLHADILLQNLEESSFIKKQIMKFR